MADHPELVAEIPKVEKMSVQDRLELAKKRRSQQLKRYERDKDKEWDQPPRKIKRGTPVKFQPRIVLLEAVSRGDTEEARKMLKNGVDPNMANDDGLTALHQACIDDCEDMVQLLLKCGASVEATDRELWTPLHAAAACGNQEIIECLLDHGANVAAVNADDNLPIDLVEEDDLIDFLQQEMDNNGFSEAKIDELMKERETTMLNDLKTALEEKQDLDVRLEQGATPLHIAAANSYFDVVEFLLENGAIVDIEDDDGWQPIHAAACWGTEEIIEVLVANGADLECQTPHGESPLELCEDDVVREFLKDLRSKVKTNKFKVKQSLSERRKRSNSRSLSVKRSSLKEKISISQSEAKAEAILRQHPQLAFLIPDDLKPKSVSTSADSGVDSQVQAMSSTSTTGKITVSTAMGAVNGNNTDKSTEPVYREECKTFVKNNYNIKVSLAKPTGGNKNDIPVEEKKSVRVQVRNMSDNNGLQYSASDAVEQRTRKESPSITEREKVVPRPVPEPRQSPQGERQAVAPVPKARTMLPANSSPKNEPAGYGSRSQNAAPASQQNSSPMALPRSTKSHAAPPVPMPRTSGSTSATVGRGDSAQETSGYPDSFQKRRSRGSREITEEEFSRVYKEAKHQRESQAASLADVELSAETETAKFSTNRPASQHGPPPSSGPATIAVDNTGSRDIQKPPPSNSTQLNDKVAATNADLPSERIPVQDDVEVERHKKSCCVLM